MALKSKIACAIGIILSVFVGFVLGVTFCYQFHSMQDAQLSLETGQLTGRPAQVSNSSESKISGPVLEESPNDPQNLSDTSASPNLTVQRKSTKRNWKVIDILVVSDRRNSQKPFRGLVNSILAYTSMPVRFNLVGPRLAWLDAIANVTRHFSIFYHDPKPLFEKAKLFLDETKYRSIHYSARHAAIKLFLPSLSFPPDTQKVLFMDDDSIFYQDLVPLYDLFQQNVSRPSMYCPLDSKRVRSYFTDRNRSNIGHKERYCIPALMGIPVGPNTTFTSGLSKAVADIMRLHPGFTGGVAADQDGLNMWYATSSEEIDLIPCEWHCDMNSCRRSDWLANGPNCSNCAISQTEGQCKGAHFLSQAYTVNIDLGRPEWNWNYYYGLNSVALARQYASRVENHLGHL